jgi:hypothetical protein
VPAIRADIGVTSRRHFAALPRHTGKRRSDQMSRISALTPERMNPEQRKVYEESVARGLPTGGPYTAYIRIPQFMALNREMSNYLRSN